MAEVQKNGRNGRGHLVWLLLFLLALAGGVALAVEVRAVSSELRQVSQDGPDGPVGLIELGLVSDPGVHTRVVEAWRDHDPSRLPLARECLEFELGIILCWLLGLGALGYFLSGRLRTGARQRFRWRLAAWLTLGTAAGVGSNLLLNAALGAAMAGSGTATAHGSWAPWIAMLSVANVVFGLLGLLAVLRALWIDSDRDLPTVDAFFRYVVHARVSWIGALVLVGGPWWMRGSRLFANTFEFGVDPSWGRPFAVGVATGLAAWTCVVTGVLTFRLAPVRFRLPAVGFLSRPDHRLVGREAGRRRWAELLSAILLTLSTGFALWLANTQSLAIAGWFAGGVAAAFAMLFAVEFVVQRFRQRESEFVPRTSARFGFLVEGYLQAGKFRLLPGHLPALTGVFVLLAVYVFMASRDIHADVVQTTPALAMLWFLVALLVAAFAGIAFAFDRLGFPVLLVVALWSIGAGYLTRSTHYFYVQPHAPVTLPTAQERFTARRARADNPNKVVLVCTAGGGIQAAAWTARVLTGLQERFDWFDAQIGLISGVSGGSVGAMYYVNGRGHGVANEEINARARASSLNGLGWALVFKDTRRVAGVRISRSMDRGIALETMWRSRMSGERHELMLSSWAANSSLIPIAFNSTMGGVGARPLKANRLVFSTVDAGPRCNHFFRTYPGEDIDVVTAARMASAFPYASPMARAARWTADGSVPVSPEHYLADGGYFDNSGVVTALDWLAQIQSEEPLDVAVVRIVGFPSADDSRSSPPVDGWANSLMGPLDLLLATWEKTQSVRSGVELDWLGRAYGRERVVDCLFRYDATVTADAADESSPEPPPLSWHLTPKQQDAIDQSWQELLGGADDENNPLRGLKAWWEKR